MVEKYQDLRLYFLIACVRVCVCACASHAGLCFAKWGVDKFGSLVYTWLSQLGLGLADCVACVPQANNILRS